MLAWVGLLSCYSVSCRQAVISVMYGGGAGMRAQTTAVLESTVPYIWRPTLGGLGFPRRRQVRDERPAFWISIFWAQN